MVYNFSKVINFPCKVFLGKGTELNFGGAARFQVINLCFGDIADKPDGVDSGFFQCLGIQAGQFQFSFVFDDGGSFIGQQGLRFDYFFTGCRAIEGEVLNTVQVDFECVDIDNLLKKCRIVCGQVGVIKQD